MSASAEHLRPALAVTKEGAVTVGAVAAGALATGVGLIVGGPAMLLSMVSGLFMHHVTARYLPGVYRPAVEHCVKDLREEVKCLSEKVEALGAEVRSLKKSVGAAGS